MILRKKTLDQTTPSAAPAAASDIPTSMPLGKAAEASTITSQNGAENPRPFGQVEIQECAPLRAAPIEAGSSLTPEDKHRRSFHLGREKEAATKAARLAAEPKLHEPYPAEDVTDDGVGHAYSEMSHLDRATAAGPASARSPEEIAAPRAALLETELESPDMASFETEAGLYACVEEVLAATSNPMPTTAAYDIFDVVDSASTVDAAKGRFVATAASELLATVPPKRDWVFGRTCLTSAVALLVGVAGVGKSTYALQVACSVAEGKSHFGQYVPVARPVIVVSAEENRDEVTRRLMAAAQMMRLSAEALARVYIISGQPFRLGDDLAEVGCRANVLAELQAIIKRTGAGLVIIDPLVEVHEVDENSNDGMRRVIADLRAIAEHGRCAVLVVHHAGKGAGGAGDQNLSRGASSVVGAVRSMVTLVPLCKQEANSYGISAEDAGDYVRVDGAKNNYSRLGATIILKKNSVLLPNGDDVGVLVEVDLPEIEDRSAGEPDLRLIAAAAAQVVDTSISVNKLTGVLLTQHPELFPGMTCADPTRPSEASRKLVVQAIQTHSNINGVSLLLYMQDAQGGKGKAMMVERVARIASTSTAV